MNRIIVDIDTSLNAKRFINMLKELEYVKHYTPDNTISSLNDIDWVEPGRQASDEEFEVMIKECEAEYKTGQSLSSQQAKSLTSKKITEWRKKNLK